VTDHPKQHGQKQPGQEKGQRHRRAVEVRVPGTEVMLVRDVLDNRMVDWRRRSLGRVDGLVLVQDGDGPPRVAGLESGPTVLGRRLGRRIGNWVRRVARRWGVRRGRVVRVDWAKVKSVGVDLDLNLDLDESEAWALEHWMREKVIRRIPGHSFKKGQDQEKEGGQS
jgi:hypothetical protein